MTLSLILPSDVPHHDPKAPHPADLLAWYDRHRRDLPWRARPGETVDPYRVWLSEIMLQQTTVAAVVPYFHAFLERWPTVHDLADADLDAVLAAWAGLGYYARARNLHKCARTVSRDLGGRFPDTEEQLRRLPGIGAYTAGAVAAIAFDRRAAAVDGNVERVVARLFAVTEPLPTARPRLRALAEALVSAGRPGDFAQAMMDLGATVCVPRRPRCMLCPWQSACAARLAGIEADLPRRAEKAGKPARRGTAFWLVNPDGAVLLRRRAEDGLLGGMMEVPSTPWTGIPAHGTEPAGMGPSGALDVSGGALGALDVSDGALGALDVSDGALGALDVSDGALGAPMAVAWRVLPGMVRHSFTHFDLQLQVLTGQAGVDWTLAQGVWAPIDRLGEYALPTVMRKIVRHVLAHV